MRDDADRPVRTAVMLHNVCCRPLKYGSYIRVHYGLEEFRSLCSRYPWGTLDEFLAGERNLLTFDDGYRNFIRLVLPILELKGIPALVFLTTGFISGEAFPYELALSNLIQSSERLKSPSGEVFDLQDAEAKGKIFTILRGSVRRKSPEAQAAFVESLAELNGTTVVFPDEDMFLSWDEVIELEKHPLVAFGAHTHTHPNLTFINPASAYREIKKSREVIEQKLTRRINVFAYPYGAHNWKVRFLARFAGIRYAFTTEPLFPWKNGHDFLRIPRVDAGDLNGHK